MLFVVRIVFGGLFFYTFYHGFFQSGPLEGVEVAMLMFLLWLGAIMMSILWAPVIGQAVSDPLTSAITEGSYLPPVANDVVRLIHQLQGKGAHRTALALCLLEGLRYPDLPHPPLLALRSVRPGSRLEKWMAREVYRYSNVKNCLHAYRILTERHGETPPVHPVPEVTLAIYGSTRPAPPPATLLEVPHAPAAIKPQRNPRIRLFEDP